MARTGRPTNDPKGSVLTVRVAARHLRMLEQRAAAEHVTLSEALRRYLDESRDGASSNAGGTRDRRQTHARA
jgi:hypothetical protein